MREHFNRWYKLRWYYLANKLADFPVQLTATFIYALVVYYMSDQLPEGKRLGLFVLMCFATSLVAQVAGLTLGSGLKVQVCIHLSKAIHIASHLNKKKDFLSQYVEMINQIYYYFDINKLYIDFLLKNFK